VSRRERARRRRRFAFRRRCAGHPGIFLANADGTFLCAGCTPPEIDLGDDRVEVWEVGSSGWLSPVVCRDCKLSIEVFVDGNEVAS
jgi:hypothetical protein